MRARVAAAREAEMAALKTTRYLDALNVFVGCVAALAVPVAIFSWYALVEKKSLSPAVAFTALAWITQMEWSINTLPDIYNLWSSLSPSVERLADFLLRAPKELGLPPGMVGKLLRCAYGTRHAGALWEEHYANVRVGMCFTRGAPARQSSSTRSAAPSSWFMAMTS